MHNKRQAVWMRILRILTISAAVMAIASPANAVTAAGQSGGNGVVCTNAVDIGYTTWNPPSPTIRGTGSWTRCDNTFTKIQIMLFKEVAFGFYTSVDHRTYNPADFGAHSTTVAQPCDSNRRWYTTITAWDRAGDVVMEKQSNTVLANCA